MKKLLLSLILAGSVYAAEIPEQNLGNWTETFQTTVGPINHTPTSVKMGFITAGAGIKMSQGSNLNGFIFPGNLVLNTNSTREQFVAALIAGKIYSGK